MAECSCCVEVTCRLPEASHNNHNSIGAALLDAAEQKEAFRASYGLIVDLKTDTPQDTAAVSCFLYECALSLRYLCKEVLHGCACSLAIRTNENARDARDEVYRGIGEAVGLPRRTIRKWDDEGDLIYQLEKLCKAGYQ
jgi:hypothetical protein